jgi:ABC-type branched-subunit amino acid transport system substrate-binding protein
MNLKSIALATAALSALASSGAAYAQVKEQFIPVLSYRTGAYAPNGAPWANGFVDYLKLVNAKGGINGVKLTFEECETGYDTARSVECYERLKGKGASFVQPLSTGATFAITEKAPADKIPVVTVGYGRSESADGSVFKWNFPIAGTYWVAADAIIQQLAKKEGGMDKLKGKKVALVYHDSPYGKEPIPLLQNRSSQLGFDLQLLPVTAPGVEQKATWLQIRQARPDYVLLWGWGVMNSTAIKEAQATGYAREKMYGVWWAGAEPDVKDVGDGAKGYNAVTMQHGAEPARQGRARHGARQGPGHGAEGRRRPGAVHARRDERDARRGGHPQRAGALRQRQGHDRRAGALWPGKPEPDATQARRARLCRRDAADQHFVCRSHGCVVGAHPYVGRCEVELHQRLAARRRADHQAVGEEHRREVRDREETDGKNAGRLPELRPCPFGLSLSKPFDRLRANGTLTTCPTSSSTLTASKSSTTT